MDADRRRFFNRMDRIFRVFFIDFITVNLRLSAVKKILNFLNLMCFAGNNQNGK